MRLTVAGGIVGLGALLIASAVSASGSDLLDVLRQRDFHSALELVRAGADPNQRYSDGKTPLMVAAKGGHAALVRALLDAGAQVNVSNNNGGTALMYAAIRGDRDTVQALFEAAAEINAVGVNGWTPLMVAAVKGHAALVRQLLERGAHANAADVYGWTPLSRAAGLGRVRVVQTLVSHPKVALGEKDDEGATAVHRAAEAGHDEVVQVLRTAGADLTVLDALGRSPAELAHASGHQALARTLNKAVRSTR